MNGAETITARRRDGAADARWKSGVSSPRFALLGALLLALAAAWLTVWLAVSQPWLGLELRLDPDEGAIVVRAVSPGSPAERAGIPRDMHLTAIAAGPDATTAPARPQIALTGFDLSEEPDRLATYSIVADFLERQSDIFALLGQSAQLTLTDPATGAETVTEIEPRPRPLWSLPAVFWVQLASGLAGFVVGAWIWSLRRTDLASQMFALSGAGLMLSALPAAIYSTRELALDGELFAVLSAVNHLGAHVFGGALIALFLVYPRRLVPPRLLLALPVALGLWLYADVARILPDPSVGMYMPVLLEMLAITALVLVQARLVRDSPAERAGLRWLGLSVVAGAGAFVAGVAVPLLLGAEPAIAQGYSFAFFLVVYGGIALGIQRYRLFDLGEWSFRVLFYVAGAVLLVALDAALIWALDIAPGTALGVSLLVVAFLYLPFRDALHRRLTGRRDMERHELFAAAMDVAFASTAAQRSERWQSLLTRLYDPLEIAPAPEPVRQVEAGDDGLELALPPVADSPALRLRYPRAGKDLFGGPDRWLATELVALVSRAADSRDAYERGVTEERQRIARDLHDDVGGRLLTGMHGADRETRPMIQAALSDIRAIISGLNGERSPLERVLAEARHEAARRLESAGIALDWPVDDAGFDDIDLDYRRAKALVSSVREAVTNVIRHARASEVRVTIAVADGELRLTIADNGSGLSADTTEGYGLRNIRQRLEAISGRLAITPAAPGTHIALALPLT
jgi:two-component system sensor histidine kinase DevS